MLVHVIVELYFWKFRRIYASVHALRPAVCCLACLLMLAKAVYRLADVVYRLAAVVYMLATVVYRLAAVIYKLANGV